MVCGENKNYNKINKTTSRSRWQLVLPCEQSGPEHWGVCRTAPTDGELRYAAQCSELLSVQWLVGRA